MFKAKLIEITFPIVVKNCLNIKMAYDELFGWVGMNASIGLILGCATNLLLFWMILKHTDKMMRVWRYYLLVITVIKIIKLFIHIFRRLLLQTAVIDFALSIMNFLLQIVNFCFFNS